MVDQRIYLPGTARWLAQQAELSEWEVAWELAHAEWHERMLAATEARRGRGRVGNPAWLHFTVLSFPQNVSDWRELLVGAHCPACRREWVLMDHVGLGEIEVVVSSGESARAVVEVTCMACLSEHHAQFTHL